MRRIFGQTIHQPGKLLPVADAENQNRVADRAFPAVGGRIPDPAVHHHGARAATVQVHRLDGAQSHQFPRQFVQAHAQTARLPPIQGHEQECSAAGDGHCRPGIAVGRVSEFLGAHREPTAAHQAWPTTHDVFRAAAAFGSGPGRVQLHIHAQESAQGGVLSQPGGAPARAREHQAIPRNPGVAHPVFYGRHSPGPVQRHLDARPAGQCARAKLRQEHLEILPGALPVHPGNLEARAARGPHPAPEVHHVHLQALLEISLLAEQQSGPVGPAREHPAVELIDARGTAGVGSADYEVAAVDRCGGAVAPGHRAEGLSADQAVPRTHRQQVDARVRGVHLQNLHGERAAALARETALPVTDAGRHVLAAIVVTRDDLGPGLSDNQGQPGSPG